MARGEVRVDVDVSQVAGIVAVAAVGVVIAVSTDVGIVACAAAAPLKVP